VPGLPPTDTKATPTAPSLTFTPIAVRQIADIDGEWRELERRAQHVGVYTTFDWLSAWAAVYRPERLWIIRIVAAGDEVIALGLVEVSRLRGWRFAGGAVTPRRSLLCAAGHEDAAWQALARWLRENPRAWSTLEACEVPQSAEAIPGARLHAHVTPFLSVPESWDAYLASLPSKRRADVRRRLRLTQNAGLEVREVPTLDLEDALDDFLRLHHLRTSTKGQQHHDIDVRLAQLLAALATGSAVEVRLVEIRHNGVRLGIRISLEHQRVLYMYNHGWNPQAASLAPGIVMALNSIDKAARRGLRTIDMGAGEQDYKMALGAVPEARLTLEARNPRIWARAIRFTYATYLRARQ
jgi:CelD/BcsL family acetyltransferase involved in cellulose biosynthesis